VGTGRKKEEDAEFWTGGRGVLWEFYGNEKDSVISKFLR
jgi:hypothetical protein